MANFFDKTRQRREQLKVLEFLLHLAIIFNGQ